MITARTKKQLIAFALITLLGVSFVGARYAQLDRLFYDATYEVNTHLKESGGIFVDAEVTYRGVGIGKVSDMRLTEEGVDVVLGIENGYDKIPADTLAVVGNKSAVGEQFVELQPNSDSGPYLKNGSTIESNDTRTPVSTETLLTNLSNLVESVPQDKLRTVVSELGAAFKGTGPTLANIIDTSTEFIDTANANFDTTRKLIHQSSTVLGTQADKASAIRSFARDLALFSGTLANHDKALRSVIEHGAATSIELRTFLEQNQVDLGRLIQNLLTTGRITRMHLKGVQQILVLYPYMVSGGYTVSAKGPDGNYDARFGLILTQQAHTCTQGYDQKQVRTPQETSDKPMNENARCTEPVKSGTNWVNPRGAQHAPAHGRTAAFTQPIATYDAATGTLTWNGADAATPETSGVDPAIFGKDAWKWMLMQPSMEQVGSGE